METTDKIWHRFGFGESFEMLKRSYIKMVKNAYNLHLDGAIVGTNTSEPANDDAAIMAMGGTERGGWRMLVAARDTVANTE